MIDAGGVINNSLHCSNGILDQLKFNGMSSIAGPLQLAPHQ